MFSSPFPPKALTSSRFLENLHHMFSKLQSVDFNQAVVSIKAANHRRTGNKHDDSSEIWPEDVSRATGDVFPSGSRVNACEESGSHKQIIQGRQRGDEKRK